SGTTAISRRNGTTRKSATVPHGTTANARAGTTATATDAKQTHTRRPHDESPEAYSAPHRPDRVRPRRHLGYRAHPGTREGQASRPHHRGRVLGPQRVEAHHRSPHPRRRRTRMAPHHLRSMALVRRGGGALRRRMGGGRE